LLKIVDAKTMQAIDRAAVEQYGIPSFKLMEYAGFRLFEHSMHFLKHMQNGHTVILAGGGKNGGDGLVCARYLVRAGFRVTVLLFPGKQLAPETLNNLKRLASENVPIKRFEDKFSATGIETLQSADLVIDALLGIGLSGSPREPMASAIRILNEEKNIVVAADIPSGLNADTGEISDPTVQADYTITFGLPKTGLFQVKAAAWVGRLIVETIGFPKPLLIAETGEIQYFDKVSAAERLPRRLVDAHKRSSGKVLIVGGSAAFHGALILAAQGALRAGAGYVSIAYPKSLDTIVRSHALEEICHPLPCSAAGALGPAALKQLLHLAKDQVAVVIGPGLGRARLSLQMVKKFLQQAIGPRLIVIDADALLALADMRLTSRSSGRPALLITPHEGEAGRLLKQPAEAIHADRMAAARLLAQRMKVTVLLKGQHTLVAQTQKPMLLIGAGTQTLSTAGTGDVLSGIIAALAAQKLNANDAAALGATIHGLAGELASCDPLGLGVTAREVAKCLPAAIRQLRVISKDNSKFGAGRRLEIEWQNRK